MERGFLSQKGSGGGRGVKKKNKDVAAKDGVSPSVTVKTVVMEKQSSLVDTSVPTAENMELCSYPPLPMQGSTLAGNTPGMSSYANVTGNTPGKKALNFRTLYTPGKIGLMSSYARAMIELQADEELKDTIVEECPKNIGVGVAKNLKKPSQTSKGVSVGLKVGFKPHKEYRHVPKKATANSSGNKKKGVEPINELSNSNPFDVLDTADNDIELGTNGGTSNSGNKGANSSGSSFWNVENNSTNTTPIIDKIGKYENLIIDGQAILMDEDGNPVKKVEYLGDHDSEDEVASVDNDMAYFMASERGFRKEQWRDSYGNGNYNDDPNDDDMYEGQDLPEELQTICDNLDIRVRGRKKK
ncbi:hypothetical protein Tco_1057304 [Tanacetum coccineum]|uniref:Uncharacterized protein n=1 Tax=Tanacetum coccineum TaxID=301880 RepID=A0ABQ5H6T0_9ASTR